MSRRDSAELFRPSRGAPDAGEEEDSGRRRFARLPVVLAALAGALLLGYLVVRYSAANAVLELSPELAAGIAPNHPAVQLERAYEELQLTGGADESTVGAAMAAFRRAPLSEVPLLIAARLAMSGGEAERADPLIAEAIRRNPRSRYALLLELDQHVRAQRADEAARTMAVLTRSFPDSRPLMTAQLAVMALDPDTRDAVSHVMGIDPRLRTDVLEQLARQNVDPEMVLALAGRLEPGAPRWQQLLIESLVERGEVAKAHEVWRRIAGVEGAAAGVYDPEFAGLPGPPPFNWKLESGGAGFAERASGELLVEYSGRREALLASQLLVLPPGTYRVSFTAEGTVRPEDGRLTWTVSCHPGSPGGLEIPVTGLDSEEREFSAQFTVPPRGCPGQWLRLSGAPSEFPNDQQVRFRQMRVARDGR